MLGSETKFASRMLSFYSIILSMQNVLYCTYNGLTQAFQLNKYSVINDFSKKFVLHPDTMK